MLVLTLFAKFCCFPSEVHYLKKPIKIATVVSNIYEQLLQENRSLTLSHAMGQAVAVFPGHNEGHMCK